MTLNLEKEDLKLLRGVLMTTLGSYLASRNFVRTAEFNKLEVLLRRINSALRGEE